jgi:hypothetical protein
MKRKAGMTTRLRHRVLRSMSETGPLGGWEKALAMATLSSGARCACRQHSERHPPYRPCSSMTPSSPCSHSPATRGEGGNVGRWHQHILSLIITKDDTNATKAAFVGLVFHAKQCFPSFLSKVVIPCKISLFLMVDHMNTKKPKQLRVQELGQWPRSRSFAL